MPECDCLHPYPGRKLESRRWSGQPQAGYAVNKPYVDLEEWRDVPVCHYYVHNGFTGTDTRFSFYFPPKEKYQGRFFQYITPVPDNENLS